MPKPFKLIEDKFSEVDNERQWTYKIKTIFNYQPIIAVTITDHPWKKSGRTMITHELICELIEKLEQEERLEPTKYQGKRKVYKWEITYQSKRYRFWFWFKDGTDNQLWIRNIHPID